MHPIRVAAALVLAATVAASAAEPKLPGVGAAMQEMVAKQEVAGAAGPLTPDDRRGYISSP